MLQDSTEEQSSSSSPSSSKRGRYEYRDGSGPSSGQPPPSYSAQRVSFLIMLYIINGALLGDVQGVISSLFCCVFVVQSQFTVQLLLSFSVVIVVTSFLLEKPIKRTS